jgi:hypothetical protein
MEGRRARPNAVEAEKMIMLFEGEESAGIGRGDVVGRCACLYSPWWRRLRTRDDEDLVCDR